MSELMYSNYLKSMEAHIDYVRQAGEKIGVDRLLLLAHDQSKYDAEEFYPYAEYFYKEDGVLRQARERTPKIKNSFSRAWLRHIHLNKHHWQHWIFPDGISYGADCENGAIPMPHRYVYEMVADWMGASKAYTGSWNMESWLRTNMPNIVLHSKTAKTLRAVLANNGYSEEICRIKFKYGV